MAIDAADLAATCHGYEEANRHPGSIDVEVLGICRNSHIGLNEPATRPDTQTRAVEWTAPARRDDSRFFRSLDKVPTGAITQGIVTIPHARRIVLVATGGAKTGAVAVLVDGPLSTPASAIREHCDVAVVAAGGLFTAPRFTDATGGS